MKDRNLFEMLENAEDNEMKRITEKTPEFSEKEIDKMLKMSEKKYEEKKKAAGNNNLENKVSGVEIDKRPVWTRYLYTAASILVLAAGIGLSVKFIPKNNLPPETEIITPAASSAAAQSSEKKTTAAKETSTKEANTTAAETYAVTAVSSENIHITTAASEVTAIAQGTQSAPAETAAPETAAEEHNEEVQTSQETTPVKSEEQNGKDAKAALFAEGEEAFQKSLLLHKLFDADCSDMLDFNDKFTLVSEYTEYDGTEIHDEFEYYRITDPRFQNIDDLKSFLEDYLLYDDYIEIYLNACRKYTCTDGVVKVNSMITPRLAEVNGALYCNGCTVDCVDRFSNYTINDVYMEGNTLVVDVIFNDYFPDITPNTPVEQKYRFEKDNGVWKRTVFGD